MKIFTDEISFIEKDIKYLKEQIHHSNNLANKASIIYSIQVLECLSYILTEGTHLTKSINKNRNLIININEKDRIIHKNKLDNFIKNKNDHLLYASSILDEEKDIYIPYTGDYYEEEFLSDDDMYKIISDFFISTNNIDANDIFRSLVESNKIYLVNFEGSSFKGIAFFNTYMNDNIVILDESSINNTVDLMTTLVHEIGHVIDYKELGNNSVYYTGKSIFIETLACIYEKKFMDYLIENSIYKRKTTGLLTDFYESMYFELNNIILASSIPDSYLKRQKYRNLDREKLYNIMSIDSTVLVPLDEFPEPKSINLMESLEYGYGKSLATYFSKLEKINKDEYNEQLNRFLELRNGYYPKNFLNKMGTNSEYVQELIDDEISSSSCKIIIKK